MHLKLKIYNENQKKKKKRGIKSHNNCSTDRSMYKCLKKLNTTIKDIQLIHPNTRV